MSTIAENVDVDVPVRTAYDQWTQFEQFSHFMEGVESVTQVDDSHMHWVAEIGGISREWDAQIIDQRPDERIAWQATDGTPNAGAVTFTPLDADHTRLHLEVEYSPDGLVESAGDALGLVRHRVQGDLDRFKAYIEHQGHESGAWRGTVANDGPHRSDSTET